VNSTTALNAKSISTSKGARRCTSHKHFSVDKKGDHQVAKMQEFIKRSGQNRVSGRRTEDGIWQIQDGIFHPVADVWRRYNSGQARVFPTEKYEKSIQSHATMENTRLRRCLLAKGRGKSSRCAE